MHWFRQNGIIVIISIRCSYARCADSLCYSAHCRQSKSVLSDNYSLHKWICEHSFNFQNLQDIQLHCQARKEVLLLGGCLAYQNSSCFFRFLLIICSLSWNVSALGSQGVLCMSSFLVYILYTFWHWRIVVKLIKRHPESFWFLHLFQHHLWGYKLAYSPAVWISGWKELLHYQFADGCNSMQVLISELLNINEN